MLVNSIVCPFFNGKALVGSSCRLLQDCTPDGPEKLGTLKWRLGQSPKEAKTRCNDK